MLRSIPGQAAFWLRFNASDETSPFFRAADELDRHIADETDSKRRLRDHCIRLQSVNDAQDEMIGRLVARVEDLEAQLAAAREACRQNFESAKALIVHLSYYVPVEIHRPD